MPKHITKQRLEKSKVRVWGIWVPMPGVLTLASIRTTRRTCIKEYTAYYTANTKPKLTWATLYKWGWRCIPIDVSFKKPAQR